MSPRSGASRSAPNPSSRQPSHWMSRPARRVAHRLLRGRQRRIDYLSILLHADQLMKSYRIAVVGATGAVGQEILRTLERWNFPVSRLSPLTSSRSLEASVALQRSEGSVQALRVSAFHDMHVQHISACAT